MKDKVGKEQQRSETSIMPSNEVSLRRSPASVLARWKTLQGVEDSGPTAERGNFDTQVSPAVFQCA